MTEEESMYLEHTKAGEMLCIWLSSDRPDDHWHEIEMHISECHFEGKVLFDFLLVNGPVRRFFLCDFSDEKLHFKTMNHLRNYSVPKSDLFFQNNSTVLSRGVLSNRQIANYLEA